MENISVEAVKARLDAGEKLNLVDVREPHEHAEFNIGGLLLPLGKVQMLQVEEIEDLKQQEVVCYCRSGNRSMMAGSFLASKAVQTKVLFYPATAKNHFCYFLTVYLYNS
jgi:rhodanese-related sulfurtransferase